MNFSEIKPAILYIVDGLEFGGGERVFIQLASELKDRFRVFTAATAGGKFEDEIKAIGVNFLKIDLSNRFSLKPIFQLKSILKNYRIDILHSQGARADFYARLAARISGVQHNVCTIAMPVEGFDVGPIRKIIYRNIDSLTERYVEKFIVVSNSLKKMLIEKRGIPDSKIVRIYNGIELNKYYPDAEDGKIRKEVAIPNSVPLIGAIGRIVFQKGFEFLIKAIPDVVRFIPSAKFLFVGDGPLKGKLRALSEELRVKDNVIFTGFRNDIKEILATIDLLVVPSLLEGFPMVTLEAMAIAKPIVATQIDGITEQIKDGQNGILVPPKDHNALSNAILKLIQDKELSKKLGMSARQRVEQDFSVEKMVAETEKIYSSIIDIN